MEEVNNKPTTVHEELFDLAFAEYYKPLCLFAKKYVRKMDVSEDIVADMLIKVWQRRSSFHALNRIKAFMFISTRNACLNYLQQAQYHARERKAIRYLLDDSDDYALNKITQFEILQEAMGLIEGLPSECRKIILLSYYAGMSNNQIAGRLRISANTVRNQKVRGAHLMNKRYKERQSKLEATLCKA